MTMLFKSASENLGAQPPLAPLAPWVASGVTTESYVLTRPSVFRDSVPIVALFVQLVSDHLDVSFLGIMTRLDRDGGASIQPRTRDCSAASPRAAYYRYSISMPRNFDYTISLNKSASVATILWAGRQ